MGVAAEALRHECCATSKPDSMGHGLDRRYSVCKHSTCHELVDASHVARAVPVHGAELAARRRVHSDGVLAVVLEVAIHACTGRRHINQCERKFEAGAEA